MKKLLLLFVLIVCAFSVPVMAQDILANYSWESSTTFGPMGSIWNSAATIEDVTGDASQARTGDGYLHITIMEAPANKWDNQSVLQGFEIEVGASYRIGLWMKGTTGEEPAVNVTIGTNDYAELRGNTDIILGEDYKYYSCMIYISDDTDLGTTDPTTIRFPVHYFGLGEIFVDDITIAKSTIAGITYNSNSMAVDFGYPIDYASSISPDAFTITVDGATVNATNAYMVQDGDNVDPIVYLVLDGSIDEDAEVKVDYNGNEELYYTDYSPNNEISALEFTGEGAVYDDLFEMPVGTFLEKPKSIQCKISPNPVTDQLNIYYENAIQSYEILDLSGKSIMESKGSFKSNLNVDVSGLETGVYMLQVIDVKGNISMAKFIKHRISL